MSDAAATHLIQINDSKMTAVSKDFFFEGMSLPVNVYLKMKTNSYLLIGKKADKASFASLHALKADNAQVFVETIDHNIMLAHIADLTSKVIPQKNVPANVKAKFLSGLAEAAMGSFANKGLADVPQLQKVSNLMLELQKNLSSFADIVTLLEGLPNDEAKHAMGTCMISLLICEEMGITQRATLEKVTLGSLLHDVGMRFLPQAMLEKPRHLWSPEEMALYEQHPIKGVEALRELKDISNDVLLIIVEHHENSQGTGFPKKIRDVKISPLGRVVGLANVTANLLFNRLDGGKSYTADEAIQYIDDILGQPFNKQVFSALKNVINKAHLASKQ